MTHSALDTIPWHIGDTEQLHTYIQDVSKWLAQKLHDNSQLEQSTQQRLTAIEDTIKGYNDATLQQLEEARKLADKIVTDATTLHDIHIIASPDQERIPPESHVETEVFLSEIYKHLGQRYVRWGGHPGVLGSGIDCSGLVLSCMRSLNIAWGESDVSAAYISNTTPKKNPKNVTRGDFIFITDSAGQIDHIEIATGPAGPRGIPIIHASATQGKVAEGYQPLSSKVSAGTPRFYKA